ncbi:NAD(P)-binding protein [Paenibacillus sp. PL91]|uniref:NAD(P)-binding protein n=1 Tax=Paenibacillus sp. PL91 TaxID=2729538 RepID=UPI00145CF05E|nr:NAD(P)-binding protein [Paenibacillus sp. PL91]MBC9201916.1 NAD(P)-binding protein [Paenibacillus sp. PL91]
MSTNVVVVGGGIAGILSALMLKDKFPNVILIENSSELGGLLKSDNYGNEHWFDKGTHLPALTHHQEINKYLIPDEINDSNLWLKLTHLKPGNYFNKKLNSLGSAIDITSYDEEYYHKILIELLHSRLESRSQYENSYEQIRDLFGEALTNNFFEKISFKFFGTALKDLAPDVLKLIINPRIIAFDENKTKELKKSNFFDMRLSLSTPSINKDVEYFYPKKGGIHEWISLLENKMNNNGIRILKGAKISGIHVDKNEITKLTLEDCEEITGISHVVWTAPVSLLAGRYNLVENRSLKGVRRTTYLFHLLLDKPFLTDRHYITCYDFEMKTFRVTIYNNFQKNDKYKCTVEVLDDDNVVIDEKKIIQELVTMGIISENTKVVESYAYKLGSYFPVITPEMLEINGDIIDAITNEISNITLAQRDSNQFFMADVLANVFKYVGKIK